jgi:RNA polymerase sigma-70 factor (ECF subfamily)
MQHGTDDEYILDLILNRNLVNEGYRLLMTKYQERMYWHIRGIVKNHNDTDDVLQNTFLKVFRNLPGFQRKSQLFTWLYRIATNESLTFLNQRKRKFTESIDDKKMMDHPTLKAETFIEEERIEQLLLAAIDELPDKQKEVFQLRYYGELTYKQISESLGTSEGALKASFHHAIKKIEKFIIQKGLT